MPVEEQSRRQGVGPLASADDLIVPGMFESDDELDEFLADLYASRRACCIVDGLPLATFNVKDFADFVTYDGLQLVDAM